MCTIRNRCVAAATTSWISCLIVASLVVAADESAQFQGPDISGLWQVEGELLHYSGHRILFAYGELRDEDYDEAMAIHFGDGECFSIVQSGSTIEGTGLRKIPCGEQPIVIFKGTVFNDNRVELTVTIPEIEEWCYREQTLHFKQTDWIGSFEGIYDPTEKVITGTFTAKQERDYLEGWEQDGSYWWFEDRTNCKWSGTFEITVNCGCDSNKVPVPYRKIGGAAAPSAPVVNPLPGCPERPSNAAVMYYKNATKSGESLEVWCVAGDSTHFELRYWRTGNPKWRCIGVCVFEDACNDITYSGPSLNDDDEPDSFDTIHFLNRDYGWDDCDDGYLDTIDYRYLACSEKLTVVHTKYHYTYCPPVCGNPCPPVESILPYDKASEIVLCRAVRRPLSDETDDLLEGLIASRCDMASAGLNCDVPTLPPLEPCDMDCDGDCDSEDSKIAGADDSYLANLDGDGRATISETVPVSWPGRPVLTSVGTLTSAGSFDLIMLANRWLAEPL
jgi:hypothetical protein